MRGANPPRFRPRHNLILPRLILARKFRYNMPNAVKKIRKVKENIKMGDKKGNDKGVPPHLILLVRGYE